MRLQIGTLWILGAIGLLIMGILVLGPSRAAQSDSADLAITGGVLLDGTGAPPVPDSVILISEGRISEVGNRENLPVPEGVQVIDASGRWVVPGLIDAHVHFFQSGGLFTRPDVIDLREIRPYEEEMSRVIARMPYTFSRYICAGVTSVLDVGGPFWTFGLPERAAGERPAPRIWVTGPLLSTYIPHEELGAIQDPPVLPIRNPAEARTTARRVLEQEPALLKIWFITGDRPLKELVPVVREAIAEAKTRGVRVAVHAMELETAKAAVEAGADVLVHSVAEDPVDDEFLTMLREKGIHYVTTVAVHEGYHEVLDGQPRLNSIERECGDPEVIRTWERLPDGNLHGTGSRQWLAEENARRAFRAGVNVVVGSDAGNIGTLHGPALHRELELLQKAGIPPADLLAAATGGAAEVLDRDPPVGTIEPGKTADLLIVREDPSVDVRNLREIESVIQGGAVQLRQARETS